MEEAKLSVNFKFVFPAGEDYYDSQLTLRDDDPKTSIQAFMARYVAAIIAVQAVGGKPFFPRQNGNGHSQPAKPAPPPTKPAIPVNGDRNKPANKQPIDPQLPDELDFLGEANQPVCPDHNIAKESKFGGLYCPTQLPTGAYCPWKHN